MHLRDRPVFSGGKPAALGPLRRPLIFLTTLQLVSISAAQFQADLALQQAGSRFEQPFGQTSHQCDTSLQYPFRARDARMAKCKPVHLTEGAEMQR